ncbi:uncharacterized protein scimp [Genypterus blacodes]|uniref:uncharacterized protein scimp n=1 Tax=Genypterus blacodes TaxID=154954 RepID=UPI003F75E9F4
MGLLKIRWLWVIVAIICMSCVICIIFILINKCIARGVKHRTLQFRKPSEFQAETSHYQSSPFEVGVPPLPTRNQFLTAEAHSYENLTEQTLYEKLDEDDAIHPPLPYLHVEPPADCPDNTSTEDYDDIGDGEADCPDNNSTEDYDDIGTEEDNKNDEDYDDVG